MYRNPETFRLPTLRRPSRRGLVPAEALRLALSRIDKALLAYRSDLHFDPARLRTRLNMVVPGTPQENFRIWSLGWLAWLMGEYDKAEILLEQAAQLAKAANDIELLARAGYWLARVQMLREKPEALAGYEALLRQLKGSPQGTVWFVDLLFRTGRTDRAEQVWKSVKANKKVSGASEAPLIEARFALRRGETSAAEKLLADMPETNGVLEAEKRLLQAWMASSRKQDATAQQLWEEASQRLYPPAALEAWRELLMAREKGELASLDSGDVPTLRPLFRAQQARREGRTQEAIDAYREAMQLAVNQPWARYGLALLGQDDLNEVQGLATSVFLATRCRLWLALQKFAQRQMSAEDWLGAVQQQLGLGMQTNATIEHFRLLGLALRQSRPPIETLQQLLDQANARQGAQRRNFLRVFLELCDRAAPAVVKDVLPENPQGDLWADENLRQELDRLRLRAALAGGGEPWTRARLAERMNSLPQSEALTPARQILAMQGYPLMDGGRQALITLNTHPRWQGPTQVLLLHDAIERGDTAEVARRLERIEIWTALRFIPRSLVAALARFVKERQALPVWKSCLPPWLQRLASTLGESEDVTALRLAAGLVPAPKGPAPAPAGVEPGVWFLHQAARLLGRGEATEAWAAAQQAREHLPRLTEEQRTAAEAALPTLERLAQAAALLKMIPAPADAPRTPPAAVLDLVNLLAGQPEGQTVLTICVSDQRKELRNAVQAVLDLPQLPERLAHHLALWTGRIAVGLEDHAPNDPVDIWWKLCWRGWLRHLLQWSAEERAPLLDHLLVRHRQTLTDRLARAAMEPARKIWAVVTELPGLAEKLNPAMKAELTTRVNAFRDDLASDYLVQTREAMRSGTIPEGFQADYDRGLSFLRRLLSLDRENVRLLTALVEICHEWFLDFFSAGNRDGLVEQLERFTPFALQLARLIEGKGEEHAPRAALSEFWKFRGFLANDPAEKQRLYEQSLQFNPTNDNVRDLLAKLNETPSEPSETPSESLDSPGESPLEENS